MSRSGYVEDYDDQWALIRWRGVVASAIRGKRGQAFLREMLAALDALPERRLVANELQEPDGAVCAIGAVGKARGLDMTDLDPDDYSTVAGTFGIAEPLAQEIVFLNDDGWIFATDEKGRLKRDENDKPIKITPEERFQKMREWVEGAIASAPEA